MSPNQGFVGRCSSVAAHGVPVFADDTSAVFPGNRPPNGTLGFIVADYDNDGYVDIYAPNPKFDGGSGNRGDTQRLYRNNGDGSFQNVTSAVGIGTIATLSGAWGDYDSDGFLDLLIAVAPSNMPIDTDSHAASWRLHRGVEQSSAPGGRGFILTTPTAAPGLATNQETRTALWTDLDKDHDVDLVTIQFRDTDAQPGLPRSSRYYRNDGGHLSDVTPSLFPGESIFTTGSFSAAPGDVDNDGDIDIVYHGQNDKGWLSNAIDGASGFRALQTGWNQNQNDAGATCWPIRPMDVDVFDYDLDGWLDMVAPSYNNDQAHVLLHNRQTDHNFTCAASGLHARQSFGMGAADFDMDGYTELFKGCLASTGQLFYKSNEAYGGTATNHWVGIRLEDTDKSCNFRGVGATVIVSIDTTHQQAQMVDGGSGHSGQHDLDLVFGLGSYSGMVHVEVIWPCGQTQHEEVSADQYHTISLTKPIVNSSSVTMYLNFALGEETLDWVFEWETATPGDNDLDWVEFPYGIPGYQGISRLDASMTDVEIAAPERKANGTYRHRVAWLERTCAEELTAYYKVHSKAISFDSASTRQTLYLFGCPLSQ